MRLARAGVSSVLLSRAAWFVLVGAAVMACASGPRPSIVVPGSATPSAGPVGLPATASPSASAAMNVDASLLDLLPPTVEDVALEFSADASREVAADPALSGDAEAVAYAIAASRESRDLLVVAVARIRPGTFTDGFFRGWRDSYDAEVCGQAGGVLGHAEAEIDARQVFIGTCVNDGRTYHAWLEDEQVIVSAFSVGQRRMGERLMEALDP